MDIVGAYTLVTYISLLLSTTRTVKILSFLKTHCTSNGKFFRTKMIRPMLCPVTLVQKNDPPHSLSHISLSASVIYDSCMQIMSNAPIFRYQKNVLRFVEFRKPWILTLASLRLFIIDYIVPSELKSLETES